MGAWGFGLLENDSAADALGDLVGDIRTTAVKAAGTALTRKTAGPFAAQLGLILHYQYHLFEDDEEDARALRRGVKTNRAILVEVAPKARTVIAALAEGELPEPPSIRGLMRAMHGRPYLQELADRIIEDVESNLDDSSSAAHLDLLCTLAPYVELPEDTMEHWLERCREALDDADEDDRPFRKAYVEACRTLAAAAAGASDD